MNIVVMRHQFWTSQCQGNGRHFYKPRDRAIPAALSRVIPHFSVEIFPNKCEGGVGTRRPLPVLAAAATIGIPAAIASNNLEGMALLNTSLFRNGTRQASTAARNAWPMR